MFLCHFPLPAIIELIFFFYHLLRKDRLYQLRPYQIESVEATLTHFRRERSPAVLVLPTGAGKSLVIAELARLAKGRVLVMAHVRELVEQNHAKFLSFGLEAGIYSADLNR